MSGLNIRNWQGLCCSTLGFGFLKWSQIEMRPGRKKGRSKTGGRAKGTLNKATREAKEFCASVVDDPAYQANIRRRALAGELPPAIEQMLWYYAKGKPVERQEVGAPGEFGHLSKEELKAILLEEAAKL
jgi:hypothetical protein